MKLKSIIITNSVLLTITLINACKKTDIQASSNVSVVTVAKGVNYSIGAPVAMAIDPQGNIYEPYTNFQFNVAIPTGHLQVISPNSLVTGYDGYYFSQIVIDAAGNFYGSYGNYIDKVNLGSGISELAGDTLRSGDADGTGYAAGFGDITCLTTDSQGNLYAGDLSNFSVRKITASGVVTTIAGNGMQGYVDGNSSTAEFEDIYGIGIDSHDNIYVLDGWSKIRKITSAGIVSTIIKNLPTENLVTTNITVDQNGNVYFINGNAIDRVDSTGKVSVIAGNSNAGSTDGNGNEARFNAPFVLISDKNGNIFVADFGNNAIRKITIN